MRRQEIMAWLLERREEKLSGLWQAANDMRRIHVGPEVHLRGLVEISNHCLRNCLYCGLRMPNRKVHRYRMRTDEILACARRAAQLRIGTVVLQAGEDPGIHAEWLADTIQRIKRETALAVTLSLGERSRGELRAWKMAGADRYLLRFETSNPGLYRRYHPPLFPGRPDRVALLEILKELGYEIGSGMLVGLPGQTYTDLVNDIELLKDLDPDMVGIGPYLLHPETPLGRRPDSSRPSGSDQVPNDAITVFKVLALVRMVCPCANLPATTAITTLNRSEGLELALGRGANVFTPNLTPTHYRVRYEIYPGHGERQETSLKRIRYRITGLGRKIGTGRGDSRRWVVRPRASSHA